MCYDIYMVKIWKKNLKYFLLPKKIKKWIFGPKQTNFTELWEGENFTTSFS